VVIWLQIVERRASDPTTDRLAFDLFEGASKMWTLVLITLLVSGSSNGGVATTTSFIDFQEEAKCRSAADAIASTQQLSPTPSGVHPNISPSAFYRVVAQCLAR